MIYVGFSCPFDNRSGREKEETLECGMIEGMIETCKYSYDHEWYLLVVYSQHIYAESYENNSYVFYCGIGKHSFDIILEDSIKYSYKC